MWIKACIISAERSTHGNRKRISVDFEASGILISVTVTKEATATVRMRSCRPATRAKAHADSGCGRWAMYSSRSRARPA